MNSESNPSDGWVHLDGAVNVRDLGGLSTDDGRVTLNRRLLRADNLQDLSAADVRLLVDDFGVRQVLDLRTAAEIELEGPGPITRERAVTVREFTLYPEAGKRTDALTEDVTGVSGESAADQLPWTSARPEPEPIDADERPAVIHYIGYLRHAADNIVESLRAIGTGPEGATLVHCAAGKDRTGMVIALALLVAGVRRQEVVADYARSGEVIDKIMLRLASTPTYAADVSDAEGNPVTDVNMDPVTWAAIANRQRPRAQTMERLLEILDERAGGPIQWLTEAGLTAEEQQAVRTRLLD
ncbi:MAG: tyrosine-protein phosphatase [Actinomycetota bacterium]|nr:tyrosine-protein phosphatase [Actinomycetota bacterium]